MAMTVLNNTAAMMTLGELNKNINKVGKDLQKVAKGQKINSAGDAASEYAVSEKMRAQLRALNQDVQNVQNGSSLLKTALGGMDEIVDNLRSMKEMAINAANDHNTDNDRRTIEKEFASRRRTINDIATTTNYNGKPLLDGTYELHEIEKITGEHVWRELVEVKVSETDPVILHTGQGIENNGIYKLASDFTGELKIPDSAKDVEITQENPSDTLRNVTIVGSPGGNQKIRIHDLTIVNGSGSQYDHSAIKFQGNNNTLIVEGPNSFAINAGGRSNPSSAIINVGDGLTIVGTNNSDLNIGISGNRGYAAGAGIGSDAGEKSSANITIGSGFNLNIKAQDGAGIGAGSRGGTIGNIYIANNAKIKIDIQNITGNEWYDAAGIGSGYSDSYAGDIFIGQNADIEVLHRHMGAAIGTGGRDTSTVGNIFIDATASIKDTDPLPELRSDAANYDEIVATTGKKIGAGVCYANRDTTGTWNIVYNQTGNIYDPDPVDIPTTVPERPKNKLPMYIWQEVTTYDKEIKKEGLSLAVHHGDKQNQSIDVHISDMHSNALGTGKLIDDKGKFAKTSDQERYDALSNDSKKQAEWLETVTVASEKTLDDIDVTSRTNANIAIRVLDGALETALDEATNIGAYVSRLEYTEANLTTASENTQASESTIRDADMAKAMTSYTKNNVLAQASQSMLAQANQNASGVLSLLQ